MLLVLRHVDGRWCAPSQQNEGEDFPEGFAAQWAEAVCETLGLPAGSLVPFVVEDDADPRKGVLLEDPNVAPEPVEAPAQPSLADEVAALRTIVNTLAPEAVAASPVLGAKG